MSFRYAFPKTLGCFLCFCRISGFGVDLDLRQQECHLYFFDNRAAPQNRTESDFLCLRNRLGLEGFPFLRRGSDSLFHPSIRAPPCIFV